MRLGISRVQVEIITLALAVGLAIVVFWLLPTIVGPKGAEPLPPTTWKTAEPNPEKLVKEFKEKYPFATGTPEGISNYWRAKREEWKKQKLSLPEG